jgi:hypothetical protein
VFVIKIMLWMTKKCALCEDKGLAISSEGVCSACTTGTISFSLDGVTKDVCAETTMCPEKYGAKCFETCKKFTFKGEEMIGCT